MKPSSKSNSLIIGLTGTIGSGKSVCSKILKKHFGLPVIDADQIAYQVVAPGSKGSKAIERVFGKDYILEDGSYNRALMRETVQKDPKALEKLNALLHPIIREEKERQLKLLEDEPVIIYDCPLLFESGEDQNVDQILVVTVDDQIRLERLMKRDNISLEEAKRRTAIQLGDKEKVERADYVLENNGTTQELEDKLTEIFKKVKK